MVRWSDIANVTMVLIFNPSRKEMPRWYHDYGYLSCVKTLFIMMVNNIQLKTLFQVDHVILILWKKITKYTNYVLTSTFLNSN